MSITERIDRVTSIPEKYRGTILPPPISTKIELTGRCNFSCTFCARSQRLRKVAEMDRHFFRRVVKEMREDGVEELGLFYLGESMLCKWLPEAIEYAKGLGYYTFLTTNGSLATDKLLNEIMAAGLDSLKFSLNYADAEQFTEITKVKPSVWGKVKEAVKMANKVRRLGSYSTMLSASYIRYTGDQMKRMEATLEELGPYLDEIYALPLYNQADLVTDQVKAKDWVPSPGNRGRYDRMREPLPCWAMLTEGHITYNGLLTGCCFDHNEGFTFGNLHEMSFMEAWNSPRAQWFREHHLRKDVTGTPCEQCVVR
jgi:MoaA/NifB/PqqE/SkfB family radical SAM enzyme